MNNRDTAIPTEAEPEVTVVRKMKPPERFWKSAAFIFGLIIAGGTILGTVGRAFYVTRDEYTLKAQEDAVMKTNIQLTLDAMKTSMSGMEKTMHEMSATVQSIQIDVARKH